LIFNSLKRLKNISSFFNYSIEMGFSPFSYNKIPLALAKTYAFDF